MPTIFNVFETFTNFFNLIRNENFAFSIKLNNRVVTTQHIGQKNMKYIVCKF